MLASFGHLFSVAIRGGERSKQLPQPARVLFLALLVTLLAYLAWPVFFQPFHWTTDASTYNRLESRVVSAHYISCVSGPWCGTDLRLADFNGPIYCPKMVSGCRHLDKNLQPGEAVKVLYHCRRRSISLMMLFGVKCSVAELDTANGFPLVTLENAIANHARSIRIWRFFAISMLFMMIFTFRGPLKETYALLRSGGDDQSEERLS